MSRVPSTAEQQMVQCEIACVAMTDLVGARDHAKVVKDKDMGERLEVNPVFTASAYGDTMKPSERYARALATGLTQIT